MVRKYIARNPPVLVLPRPWYRNDPTNSTKGSPCYLSVDDSLLLLVGLFRYHGRGRKSTGGFRATCRISLANRKKWSCTKQSVFFLCVAYVSGFFGSVMRLQLNLFVHRSCVYCSNGIKANVNGRPVALQHGVEIALFRFGCRGLSNLSTRATL